MSFMRHFEELAVIVILLVDILVSACTVFNDIDNNSQEKK